MFGYDKAEKGVLQGDIANMSQLLRQWHPGVPHFPPLGWALTV